MNRSIIITRYARALVRYVRDTGEGDIVCSEALQLLRTFREAPDLRRMVRAASDVVSERDKKKLLQMALGNRMSPDLSRFLSLLNRNGRMDLAEDILRVFSEMYHRSIGIRRAHLTCVGEPSERLLQRLKALVKQKTGDDVIIEVSVDPALIGGFVFDIDSYLLDASVKHQLDLIREEFTERNRRII
jgi:F-type H+-transporting ATPase subunit delta